MAQLQQDANKSDCDVLVVGGGPAGATIAALLAERGRRVVLVEKTATRASISANRSCPIISPS